MLIFKLAARANCNQFACNAVDITRIEQTSEGRLRLTFSHESGGGALDVEGNFDEVRRDVQEAKRVESGIFAAAFKAKKTLEDIGKTIQAGILGEVERTVVKKLDTILGQKIEAHLTSISAEAGEAFGEDDDEREGGGSGGKKN